MKLRIKFKKYGCLKFIGHLDVMRYFQKLMRRSGIDILYSEGYSPHQIMSFASPLGVGLQSNAEYVDIEVGSITTSEKMKQAFNQHTVEGIEILSVRMLPEHVQNAMASVALADYMIRFRPGEEPDFSLSEAIDTFYNRDEILVTKETKKSTRVVDLKASVPVMKWDDDHIFLQVLAGSGENIKPELVILSLFEFCGKDCPEYSYEVTREELYTAEGMSLEAVGELF